jgi:hypothetical protein
MKTVLERPLPGPHRIAQCVDRRIIEIDATGQQAIVVYHLTGDVACRGAGINAGDQKPLGASGSEQCKRVGNARVAAGQHHDTVGVAIELDLLVGELPDEIGEAAYKQDRGKGNELSAD